MLPNDVETEPIIIASPKPTLFDFGYMLCERLDALKTVWVGEKWDMEIWREELKPHLIHCPLCAANRQALTAYRELAMEG